MNELINYKGVCRTAPATLGLLIMLIRPWTSEILWTALKQFHANFLAQENHHSLGPSAGLTLWCVIDQYQVSGPQYKAIGARHQLRLKDSNQSTVLQKKNPLIFGTIWLYTKANRDCKQMIILAWGYSKLFKAQLAMSVIRRVAF